MDAPLPGAMTMIIHNEKRGIKPKERKQTRYGIAQFECDGDNESIQITLTGHDAKTWNNLMHSDVFTNPDNWTKMQDSEVFTDRDYWQLKSEFIPDYTFEFRFGGNNNDGGFKNRWNARYSSIEATGTATTANV